MSFNERLAAFIDQLTPEEDEQLQAILSTERTFEVYKALIYRSATVRQLTKVVGASESVIYKRMQKLRRAGVVERFSNAPIMEQVLARAKSTSRGPHESVWRLKNYEAKYEWKP